MSFSEPDWVDSETSCVRVSFCSFRFGSIRDVLMAAEVTVDGAYSTQQGAYSGCRFGDRLHAMMSNVVFLPIFFLIACGRAVRRRMQKIVHAL